MKMKAEQNYQSLLPNNIRQFSQDGDEGGLDLGQILGIIRRHVFLITGITFSVAALAVLKALNDPPTYQGQFEILIEPTTIETEVISSTNPDTLSQREEITNVRDEAVLKILKSPELLNPIVEELQPQFPNISYGKLLSGLRISTIGQELQVVNVSYQDLDKELAQSVLEKVSQTYLDYSRETRESSVRRGMKFVENQLPQVRERVSSLEMRLQKIRQDNNLVNPEIKGQELANSLSGVRQQQLETQIQLEEAKEVYAELQKELAQQSAESAVAATLNQSSRFQNLLNQLQEIDSQMAKDSVLLFEDSSEMKILKNQRESLLPFIRQEAQRIVREKASQIITLETRIQILNETINSLNEQLKKVSVIIRDYTAVQRELNIANESLNQFLSERESLLIDISQTENPWRLLIAPQEPQVMAASLKRNLVLGIILGLLLGIGIALLVDKSSNRLYSVKELKELSQLPVLGVIPFEKELVKITTPDQMFDLINQDNDRHFGLSNGHKSSESRVSGFHESFRSLYTKLRFVKLDSPTRSLVISSATPGEGKSTVAIYLAQAAAALGQRVLLVDADLRDPSLHKHLKLPNLQGLTDILSLDQEAAQATVGASLAPDFIRETLDLNLIIQRSPLEDNLFILTSGSKSSVDSTKLLASKRMQDLMQELETTFDLVIYKAPSLSGLADTPLLATTTDGVLLVVSLGNVKTSILEKVLDELKLSNTEVLGIVGNHTS